MRHTFKLLAAASAVVLAPAANAADFLPGTILPNGFFIASGDTFNGPVSGAFGRSGLPSETSTDRFLFTIDQDGFGSGSVTTTPVNNSGPTDLDFLSVSFFNGFNDFPVTIMSLPGGQETGRLDDIPIFAGVQNILTVSYLSRGAGSYAGQLVFAPNAVPEPSSWAMLLLGFGGLGWVIRRRKTQAKVSYAF